MEQHVVVTSVDRDDVADRGAAHTRRRSMIKAKLPPRRSKC
jgi:lipoate synthase